MTVIDASHAALTCPSCFGIHVETLSHRGRLREGESAGFICVDCAFGFMGSLHAGEFVWEPY